MANSQQIGSLHGERLRSVCREEEKKQRAPSWLLQRIPNVMPLLIPSGKHSEIRRCGATVTEIGRGSSQGRDGPVNRRAEPQPSGAVSGGLGGRKLSSDRGGREERRKKKRIPPVTPCQNTRPQCHALAVTQLGEAAAGRSISRHTSTRHWLAGSVQAAEL